MSILARLITALLVTVIVLYSFVLFSASSQVVDVLTKERKENIQAAVNGSMNDYRFAFYSKSSPDIKDWLSSIFWHYSVDHVALISEDNKIIHELGELNSVLMGGGNSYSGKQTDGSEHFLLEVPMVFEDGASVKTYKSVALLIKSSQKDVYTTVFKILISILMFSVVILIPLVMILTHWVGRPVKTLTKQIAAITPGNVGQTPVGELETTPAELKPIIRKVNALLLDIKGYTENLDKKVMERTEMLQYAYQNIQSRDKRKQALISNLSHDLKTPLQSLKGYLELAQENIEEADIPKADTNIGNALSSGDKLLDEINTILNITTAELDGSEPLRKVDVEELLLEMVQSHGVLTQKSGSSIVVNFDGLKEALINDSVFNHVIDNLLSNCNKYANGSDIVINARVGGVISVSVIDEGVLMADDTMRKLFEPKREVGNKRFTLSGMGLFLCRSRVLAADGTIEAQKNEPKGLIVSFTLPNMDK